MAQLNEGINIFEGISGAVFSPGRKYRYALWRLQNRHLGAIMFVGLNPSIADEYKDDPTVRKLAYYTKRLGYGGLFVANLYAKVGTNPHDVIYNDEAIGQDNDFYLTAIAKQVSLIIVGWGNRGIGDRAKTVLDILGKPIYCFSITKLDMPGHPLYLSHDTGLTEYLPAPQFRG